MAGNRPARRRVDATDESHTLTNHKFDLVVIGSGAAALGAARAGRRLDKSVAMISDGPVGGDCTFTGCVPSKTLLAQARLGADYEAAHRKVVETIEAIAGTEDATALGQESIEVIEGRGRFVDAHTVEVEGARVSAEYVAVATGASPVVPPIEGIDEIEVLTNETIFSLDSLPASLAILGGGPVGCELALAFSRLGAAVTLFEAGSRLLSKEEPEASAAALDALEGSGVTVRLDTPVRRFSRTGDHDEVISDGGPALEVERVLVATGRRPTTSDLGLDLVGVRMGSGGAIKVDAKLRTSVDNIYAIGDVNGLLPFTHAADEMGRLAVGHMFSSGPRWKFDASVVPWVTFVEPEVARVGCTEATAGRGARVAFVPLAEIDRALTDGTTAGFIKIIAEPKRLTRGLGGGRITGATIVAPHAGEMIHELALAVRTNMFTGRLAQLVHAYPTMSSGIAQATAQFFYTFGGRTARPARRG
jgi:pyruvate/2-oxoglutarate dehydrogenase complex dihydrolipoamide dehydrogenase (E3) component